ncbi:hypothetical protein Pcinc_013772 [Petrolisthes cinctipes]|uniref:Reverse transcriptase domain-containing protein n=1 Tax=Petrolisthes cinctipes TaxID=88211 RepID=A0AAE1FWC1_PETCI|nr:hypothetical protein Pcinc_013772 [Petrolisthes cinctipes]
MSDFDFVDDAVILSETLEVLVTDLEVLHKEMKCLGLSMSWTKAKVNVQDFWNLLGDNILYSLCILMVRTVRPYTASLILAGVQSCSDSDGELIQHFCLAYGVVDSTTGVPGIVSICID